MVIDTDWLVDFFRRQVRLGFDEGDYTRTRNCCNGVLRYLPDDIETLAQLGEAALALSPREFDLLEILMRQPGAVLSLDLLEKQLYTWGNEVTSNAVEVHLHNLRKKLGEPWIVNVRGVGYKLVQLA